MSDYLPDDYVPVHKRVETFRDEFKDEYPRGDIITSIENISENFIGFKAEIWVDKKERQPVATGHGFETNQSSKGTVGDKWREKAETVAVGRALAFFGYDVEGGIASREEVKSAQQSKDSSKQKQSKDDSKGLAKEDGTITEGQQSFIFNLFSDNYGLDVDTAEEVVGTQKQKYVEDLSMQEASNLIELLKDKQDKAQKMIDDYKDEID